MAQKTGIEWTDASSNPIRYRDPEGKTVWGCIKTSPGCAHCYAETLAHRYGRGGPFTSSQQAKLTPFLDEKEMKKLLHSKILAGKKVFLCDMTDAFGEWVPFELLDQLFAMMALRQDVIFQVLTKRVERMAEYFTLRARSAHYWKDAARTLGWALEFQGISLVPFPLPNVWLGVSVENQEMADRRIPELLKIPARIHFLSVEPLLGPVDLRNVGKTTRGDDYDVLFGWRTSYQYKARNGSECSIGVHSEMGTRIDWVIVGGESGPQARPCNVEWIRSLVRQCKAAGVACFVKQGGSNYADEANGVCGKSTKWPLDVLPSGPTRRLKDAKGGAIDELPEDIRIREIPQ